MTKKKKAAFYEDLYDYMDDGKHILVQRDISINDTKLNDKFWRDLSYSINKALEGLFDVTVESCYLNIKRNSLKSKPTISGEFQLLGTRKMTEAEMVERNEIDDSRADRDYLCAKNEFHSLLGEHPTLRDEL